MTEKLYQLLENYKDKEIIPFHMPGHKRNPVFEKWKLSYDKDITEIDGFDNLHHPEGVLEAEQKELSKIYGSCESLISVNGSTACILSAISAAVKRGGRILTGRNCHKAVYNGIFLRSLRVSYLYPPQYDFINGSIDPNQVRDMLEKYPDTGAVLITSPTYDGVVSDIKSIGEVVHQYGIPLIVDEAHGAHFPFSQIFPDSAINNGADLVIQSLHKTLPSPTQTAVLHRCTDMTDIDKLKRYMSIYQSSSPSYILMSGISACTGWIKDCGRQAFDAYGKELIKFRRDMASLKNLHLLTPEELKAAGIYDYDISKLIFVTEASGLSGKEFCDLLLDKYKIQMEMAAASYGLALSSVGDTKENYQKLKEALYDIDRSLKGDGKKYVIKPAAFPEPLVQAEDIEAAYDSEYMSCPIRESVGKISGEFVYIYPPGIPLLVPGEIISQNVIDQIISSKHANLEIQGLIDYTENSINVLL